MPVQQEITGTLIASQVQASGFASELTVSATTFSPFGGGKDVNVRASLTRFMANNTRPGGAAVGVSSFTWIDGFGIFRTVSNGNSLQWPAFAEMRRVVNFTVSLAVVRCDAKASWVTQTWG